MLSVCGCWKGHRVLLRCGRGEEERVLLLREGVGVERGKEVLLLSEGAGSGKGEGPWRGRGSATTASAAHNNDRYIPRVRRKRHGFAPRSCRRDVMAKRLLLFGGNSRVKWDGGILNFFTNIGRFTSIKIKSTSHFKPKCTFN